MDVFLSYTNKNGSVTTETIAGTKLRDKLIELCRLRKEALAWKSDDRNVEVGWVFKHSDTKRWYWNIDETVEKF